MAVIRWFSSIPMPVLLIVCAACAVFYITHLRSEVSDLKTEKAALEQKAKAEERLHNDIIDAINNIEAKERIVIERTTNAVREVERAEGGDQRVPPAVARAWYDGIISLRDNADTSNPDRDSK